jgi:hypothetical protein
MKFAIALVSAVFVLTLSARLEAQAVQGGARSAQSAAPIDLTGYYVSVVTEDWRYRMMTPPKGDFPSIPLNPEGRKIANAWDPAKDEAAGEACKAYGAGNVMRMPGRIHITWHDDNTLKVETDTGNQIRLFHFGKPQPPTGAPDWQGFSVAQWELAGGGPRRGAAPVQGGDLKVVTTHVRAGYLQKNGVPYSADAVITEHFDLLNKEANGDQWLIVTTLVDDPQYLNRSFQRSTHFKRLPDASGWDPTPCSAQ